MLDTFNKKDFEQDIIECISGCPNVKSIQPCDSQKEVGIQFVDNLCSVFRLHKTNRDKLSFNCHGVYPFFFKDYRNPEFSELSGNIEKVYCVSCKS